MAIWPFGRKGKRSSVQFAAGPETVEKIPPSQSPEPGNLLDPEHGAPVVGRKPSRKRSRRQKSRPVTPPARASDPSRDEEALSPPRRAQTSPQSTSAHQQQEPVPSPALDHRKSRPYTFDDRASRASTGHDQSSVSRTASLLRGRRVSNERAVLKKNLSSRKASELAREQEIRAMASSPMTIPKRPAGFRGEQNPWDIRRGPSVLSRNTSRHASDSSLPMRDSAGSSLSEGAESYTFKVNAFAALTPRPIIRYAESPRYTVPRSQGPSVASSRRDHRHLILEEDFDSKQRVDELADDLDASALRELLERDRRRKERKRLEDREKLQRRLQRRADRQREEERRRAENAGETPGGDSAEDQHGRREIETGTDSAPLSADDRGRSVTADSDAKGQSGSWLRSPSRESDARSESAHVVGTLDDSSIRDRQVQRDSMTSSHLSQEMKVSRSTLSLSHSPVRQNNTSASQFPGAARESASDLSRTVDTEKRLSDGSGKRMNAWSSIFRRGGSRLKRSSWERRQGPPSEFSNASKESFSRMQTPPSAPPPAIPERSYLRPGPIQRSQSKFTEHLGDFPISPPDSRLHSPDIPETIRDMSPPPDQGDQSVGEQPDTTTLPGVEIGRDNGQTRRKRHLEASSSEVGGDGGLFSTSLASIDSEGSWMSGKYLRRISQTTNNAVRQSVGSSMKNRIDEYAELREVDDVTGDEYFAGLTPGLDGHRDSLGGTRRASSTAMGIDSDGESCVHQVPEPEPAEATWHRTEIGRRPTVVRPEVRPKSKSGLLNDVKDSEPASPVEANTPVEEEPAPEIHRATSVDVGRGHARQISAGSARLLDIPPRTSPDSKPLTSESTAPGGASWI